MNLYNPVSLKQQLAIIDGEWVGEYQGYILRSAFQPILTNSLTQTYGYEGLVRATKEGTPVNPLSFFSGFVDETEIANVGALCASMHVRNFALAGMQGKIFLNSHPTMFARVADDQYSVDKAMERVWLEGLTPEDIVWEITEFKESDTNKFLAGMGSFRETGCQIAIDDYGQLESNAKRVDLLKPDIIKMDRALIRNHCEKGSSYLSLLSKFLCDKGYKVLLEGVETHEEYELLKAVPHHFVQGYLFGRPAGIKQVNPMRNTA